MNYAEVVKKCSDKTSSVTMIKDQANLELGRDLLDHEEHLLLSKFSKDYLSSNIDKVCKLSLCVSFNNDITFSMDMDILSSPCGCQKSQISLV